MVHVLTLEVSLFSFDSYFTKYYYLQNLHAQKRGGLMAGDLRDVIHVSQA